MKNNTRQNIIDAFWSIYESKKIETITVKEVIEKAGYNRTTFYEYFKDVREILEVIEQSILPDLSQMPVINNDDPLILIENIISMYEKDHKYLKVLLGENGDPTFSYKIKQTIKEQYINQLATHYDYTLKAEYTLEFIVSGMVGLLSYWLTNNENMDRNEFIKLIIELMNQTNINQLKKLIN